LRLVTIKVESFSPVKNSMCHETDGTPNRQDSLLLIGAKLWITGGRRHDALPP